MRVATSTTLTPSSIAAWSSSAVVTSSPAPFAITTAALNEKFERLQTEAKKLHTRCEIRVEPTQSRSTLQTLLDCVPHSSDVLLICGTRIRQKRFGFLAGTVAQRLLQNAPFNVLALRVVQPGLLGQPGDFLIPVSGHPHGFDGGGPVLNLFAPGIRSLHVLHVIRRSPLIFRLLSAARARRLIARGRELARTALKEIETRNAAFSTGAKKFTDARAVLSDDWAKEILIQANQLKTRIIFMGASRKSLPGNSVSHFFDRYIYGNPLEQILRQTPCDVGLFRAAPAKKS